MDPASQLFRLRQGNQPIQDYVTNFCELCHLVDFNDIALKDIFHHGLKDSLNYLMPRHTPHWTLEQYIEFAFRLACSPFTVGVADEEPCYPPLSAKPGNFSVMSGIIQVTSEPFHAMPAKPEPVHIMSAKPQPALIESTKPEPCHAKVCIMPASALLQPAHKMAAIPEPVHKMAAIPEPAHKMATIPKSVHKMAIIPKPVHKMATITKPVHKMAAPSESLDKIAATPEPHQAKIISSASHPIISATPKANQVMPDSPVSSQASKSSQVAAAFLS
ncbi:Foot protein 1 variant 1 [Labeo rohita]|uniref:Foot protein 1 variant 1 n=1 Tax=Labeo rohita TaxID=84645 RepID=A0ABQ8L6F8_LABRO|nr:Foot protein 1 variant 1 [Labeo rohita]